MRAAAEPMPLLQGPLLALARRDVQALAPTDTVFDAARLMAAHRLDFVPVLDAQRRALGVVTETRLLAAVQGPAGPRQPIVQVMQPPLCVPQDIDAAAGFQRCMADGGRPLLLVDGAQRVVAVIGEGEFRARLQQGLTADGDHVSALMARVLRPLTRAHTLAQAVEQMAGDGCSAVVVVDGGQAVGLLTMRDVTRLLATGAEGTAVRLDTVMSQPVLSIGPQASLTEAADRMRAGQVRHLAVQDEAGRLLGVLDEHPLTLAMALQGVPGIGGDITALRRAEDEYRWLFTRNPAPMFLYDRQTLALLRVNEAFCELYGYTAQQALGLRLSDLYRPEDQAAMRQRLAEVQGLLVVGERRHVRADGRVLHLVVRSHDTQQDGRACRIVVVTDVTTLQRNRQRDQQRLALMERLARGDSLASLLDQLVLDHEALFPDSLCSVLLIGDDGSRLYHGAAPSLPPAWVQAIDGLPLGPDVGSFGAAMHARQRVIVEDIDLHPAWASLREQARQSGLRACWSDPIIGSGGNVLGSLAVYRREPAMPQPEELDHLQFAVQLAATAITHGSTTRALRASERRLQEVLQAIPDMVWQKDAGGVYQTCNAAFARMAGLPIERIIGSRDEHITEPSRADDFRRQDQQVLASGEPLSQERWMTIRSTGQHVLTELIKTPLFDEAGRPAGVLGVARDITLIKQGARAIAEQQRLIDTMLGQTTDSIVLMDPATLQFVTFNDAACRGLGYSREDFAGLTPRDLQVERELPEIRSDVQRAMAGEQIRFDARHWRADGGIQHAAMTLRRVPYGGRSLLSAVWRDVTDERRNQARIQRLNRSYAVLSGVNEAVVRLREREALFAEVCRVTIEVGGFTLAWIGQVDEASGLVVAVAEAGKPAGYVQSLQLSVSTPDSPGANGPVGRALQGGEVQVVQNVATSPAVPLQRQALLALGFRSLAAFPILPAGGHRLALVVYSGTAGHFDDEQVALFSRLAQDVAFALEFVAAQQARDEAQRFREQLIESVAGLFFALDPDGRLVLWNRRLEELGGYPADELGRRHAVDFFGRRDRPQVAARLREALERGEVQVEARLVSRDGRRTPHLFVVRRLATAQGPLLVGTGVDISARVRSERRLARYGNQLGFLVRQRTAELETVNARLQREDRRLRAMLALSQRASGLGEDELFRQGLQEILALTGSALGCVRSVRDGDPALRLQAWAGSETPPPEALALHVRASGQACIVEGDDAERLCNCRLPTARVLGVPVIEGARVVLVVCAAGKPDPYDDSDSRELQLMASDLWAIVQRRRIEIALGQAKAAADAASQAKSAFLANMSHEIRTPMNAVIGFAHLLRRDPLTPRQLSHLGKITDASQHLMQVINDILDFSKIEAHKVTLEETDFVLRGSLERVRAMQLDAARSKQLPLMLDLDPACPAELRGDRLRLEQVLLNLLSNAVKFTESGRVDLRVRVLEPAGDALWLRFELVDTGIGMTEDQLSHVFEAFAQADVSTTRRFGGTGLGLAISKRMVQLMQGRIGSCSQPGVGSTFWVELPFQRVQREDSALPLRRDADPRAPQPGLGGLRVLVAEDNPINQEVTATLLDALGVQVQMVASGEEVLRVFDPRQHDLILMDVQMPGMDGLRATTALRQRADGREVPIIAMTANAFAEDRQQCLAAGMNDYLSKPVTPQALERCLRRWQRRAPASVTAGAGVAADADTLLRGRLHDVAGLDLHAPLARMRGAWPLYLRTLRLFIDHHGADAERLADPVLAGDAPALRTLVHSLAGAAATVGAVAVQREAKALQQLLDSGADPGPEAWRPLATALHDLLLQVRAALHDSAAAPPAATAVTPALRREVQAVLLQLQPLVATHDSEALALFERHRALLQTVLGDDARTLARQLGTFSFDLAQDTLAQVLQPMPSG